MKKYFIIGYLIVISFLVFSQESQGDITGDITDGTTDSLSQQAQDSLEKQKTEEVKDIQTAADFLAITAERYAVIEDLRADLQIIDSLSDELSVGVVFVKPPSKMRINFTTPKGQVINNNGLDFYIYIPKQNVALYQKKVSILNSTGSSSTESFITKTGLDLLIKNYLVSYENKPEFFPLKNNPEVKVLQLNLEWKSPTQNFRELSLFVGEDFLIYQVDAVTYNRNEVSFSFNNFEINKGIPDNRFDYDPPPTAHVIENFLFDETQKRKELEEEANE